MEANGLEFKVLFHNLGWQTVKITKMGMTKGQQIPNQSRLLRIWRITPSSLVEMMVVKLQEGGAKGDILWTGAMCKKLCMDFNNQHFER